VAPGAFSYYLLSLSWAPDFCAQPGSPKNPAECGTGRRVGFVVHGLWPQADSGPNPENCAPASPVAQSIVQLMLKYIPTAGLIQHEWATHGTCSGLSAADYFATVRKARDSVNIPPDFAAPQQPMQLAPSDIDAKFAAANSSFPAAAFHASCTGSELQEVRICFNQDATPRACPASLNQCTAGSILVRPVR
jgi:ribonuclease T2